MKAFIAVLALELIGAASVAAQLLAAAVGSISSAHLPATGR